MSGTWVCWWLGVRAPLPWHAYHHCLLLVPSHTIACWSALCRIDGCSCNHPKLFTYKPAGVGEPILGGCLNGAHYKYSKVKGPQVGSWWGMCVGQPWLVK